MATSVISNVIKDPTGAVVSGAVVTATLMPVAGFRVDTSAEVARTVATTSDGTGSYSLALEQNANITPANTYYEIVEYIPASQGGTQVWHISVGASNQTVLAALVSVPPSASQASFLTQAAGDARYQALGSFGSVVAETAGAPGTSGVNASASRSDHVHPAAVAAPTTVNADGTGAVSTGVASTFAASDHGHVLANPAWTSFTPTFTQGVSVALSASRGRWVRVGRMIFVTVTATFSGAGTAGSAILLTNLPVSPADAASVTGSMRYFDAGNTNFVCTANGSSGTTLQFFNQGNGNQFGATGSATVSNGDFIVLSVFYEAAT